MRYMQLEARLGRLDDGSILAFSKNQNILIKALQRLELHGKKLPKDFLIIGWLAKNELKGGGIPMEIKDISYKDKEEKDMRYETVEIKVGFQYSQIFDFLEKMLEQNINDKLVLIAVRQAIAAVNQEVSDDAKDRLLMNFINNFPEEAYGEIRNLVSSKFEVDIDIKGLKLKSDSCQET